MNFFNFFQRLILKNYNKQSNIMISIFYQKSKIVHFWNLMKQKKKKKKNLISISITHIMSFSSRRFFVIEDLSIFIFYKYNYHQFSKFELAFELWCENVDIFRNQYISLKEILTMLKFHSQLNSLSKFYSTLKIHTKKNLFLLHMRKKIISLKFRKITTIAENKKKRIQSAKKLSRKI